jgi:hypothetical protein
MQALCEQLCEQNDIWITSPTRVRLQPPPWEPFFREMSRNVQPSMVEHLRVGPVQRRRRKQREVVIGGSVDLYSAVLIAISHRLPSRRMTPVELSDELATILKARPPIADIKRACREMAEIAMRH